MANQAPDLHSPQLVSHISRCLSNHNDLVYTLEKAIEELEANGLTNGIYQHALYLLEKVKL